MFSVDIRYDMNLYFFYLALLQRTLILFHANNNGTDQHMHSRILIILFLFNICSLEGILA